MQTPTSAHLVAFSTLLARDEVVSQLNMRDLQMLALLVAHDTPLAVHAVATMLSISAPYVSRMVDKMVKRDLVARRDSLTDRRIALLEPTSAGRALDARVSAHYRSAIPESV